MKDFNGDIVNRCNTNNVFVDTAFLSIPNISKLCEIGLSDRILFGTDFPITNYFYQDKPSLSWYRENIAKFVEIFGEERFTLWGQTNYHKLLMTNDTWEVK